ncbi:MAG: lipopolysaccharide heptosyltransferase I [Rhizobiaceae bacterium]|nr:lipopolysaccharide heptosyltransferase I [Rhizobiaceae bacterium]
MKVLLVKTSSMGDVIHTFPAVTDLLAARPATVVDWLVEEPFAPLARLHPGVRKVIPVAMRRWRKNLFRTATWREIRTLRGRLKAERYDLVLDAQGLLKSALLASLASAPVEGFGRATVREPMAAYFYRQGHDVLRARHAIQRTRALFGLVFGYTPDFGRLDHGIPADRSTDGDTAFLLHGTSRDDKKWPTADWIETARLLAARGLTPTTTWSNDAERRVAEAIAAANPQTLVLPRMPLGDLAPMLGRSRLVVGADTGLTHLATAYGVPTVAIFVATKPGLTGPLGDNAIALTTQPPLAPDRLDGEMLPQEIAASAHIAPTAVVETAARLAGLSA